MDGNQYSEEDGYVLSKLDEEKGRPRCISCGDPVKIIIHSGGVPLAAQHCRECYAELRWNKIPKIKKRRPY